MSTALATVKQIQSVSHSQTWTPEQIDLVKRTICKDATNDELSLFLHVAQKAGLDPFLRQIHSVKRWNKEANRFDMQIQLGIDGFRLIAMRSGGYAGSDDPVFDSEKEPNKATVTVYKIVQGQRCPFTATARWDEYFPGEKQGFMWKSKPCLMLSKCAEALALRKAFPAELSGLYTEEELARTAAESEEYARTHVVGANVRPEQPPEGDGFTPDNGYMIDFGQWNRRSLEQVYNIHGAEKIASYITYLEDTAVKKNQPIDPNGKVGIFIREAEQFLGAMENGAPA